MRLVYRGATGALSNCVKFYGITILRDGPVQGLFLVFELASEGPIDEYLEAHAEDLSWDDVVTLFYDIASGLGELHARWIIHGFMSLPLIVLTFRDMHQGNVLINKRYHGSSLLDGEENHAVLIDFGRGKWTEGNGNEPSSEDPAWSNGQAQDMFDYGSLIGDLALQWITHTKRTTLPPVVLEVILKCTCQEPGSIEEVLDIWEQWFVSKTAGAPRADYIESSEAWGALKRSEESSYSTTRSKPSAVKRLHWDGNVSAESLD